MTVIFKKRSLTTYLPTIMRYKLKIEKSVRKILFFLWLLNLSEYTWSNKIVKIKKNKLKL